MLHSAYAAMVHAFDMLKSSVKNGILLQIKLQTSLLKEH